VSKGRGPGNAPTQKSTLVRGGPKQEEGLVERANPFDNLARKYRLTPRERKFLELEYFAAALDRGTSYLLKEVAAEVFAAPRSDELSTQLNAKAKTLRSIKAKIARAKAQDTAVERNMENSVDAHTQMMALFFTDDEVDLKLVQAAPSPLPFAVEPVIDRAIEVIGGRDEALRWLGTPVRALDYATPISLLGTPEGITRVQDVLGRMEHGVW